MDSHRGDIWTVNHGEARRYAIEKETGGIDMKEWLERLTDAQRAKFAELGEHISLVTLAKFCEDEGLELLDVSLDVTK